MGPAAAGGTYAVITTARAVLVDDIKLRARTSPVIWHSMIRFSGLLHVTVYPGPGLRRSIWADAATTVDQPCASACWPPGCREPHGQVPMPMPARCRCRCVWYRSLVGCQCRRPRGATGGIGCSHLRSPRGFWKLYCTKVVHVLVSDASSFGRAGRCSSVACRRPDGIRAIATTFGVVIKREKRI